ncbi:hypothetical protein DWB67_04745 [Paracoccus sp. JM45]|nr:hypothetical protein DWB67_04745 [Paracoccus sp. JM45]
MPDHNHTRGVAGFAAIFPIYSTCDVPQAFMFRDNCFLQIHSQALSNRFKMKMAFLSGRTDPCGIGPPDMRTVNRRYRFPCENGLCTINLCHR